MTEPRPDDDPLPHDHRRARRPHGAAPLRRSRRRWIGGVAGGIAAFVGVDPLWVRGIFLLAVPLTIGVVVVAYGLLWMLLPGPGDGPGSA